MRSRLALVFAFGAFVGFAAATGSPLAAHHSYAATYDVSKEVKLTGKLVQLVYRNPHSFVHIEAPDPDGTMQRWAVEWSGTSQLDNQGVKREVLKVGDQIVIVGRPSRVPGEYRALMVSLIRPSDGFTWGGRGGQVVD
jgi:DNA/RNA endonuclease YhcR with UshA esterase domain